MHLYLMQHGVCFSKDLDPEQPLSPLGREAVERSARALRAMGCRFDLMLASPKLRAAQTAAIVAKALHYPEADIQVTETVKAMASPRDTLEFLDRCGAKHVFVAGHQPHLGKLAGRVISADGSADLAVENSGVTLLEITSFSPLTGRLLWHLPPSALQMVRSG